MELVFDERLANSSSLPRSGTPIRPAIKVIQRGVADEVLAADYIDHTSSNPKLAGRENMKRFAEEWLAAFPTAKAWLKIW